MSDMDDDMYEEDDYELVGTKNNRIKYFFCGGVVVCMTRVQPF